MSDILVKAFSLVAIIAVGHIARRRGWVKATDFMLFVRLVLWVTLPAVIITSFNDFTLDFSILILAGVGLTAVVLQQLIGWFLTRGRPASDRAFALLNIGSYNVGAFAIPYIQSFMGPAAVVHASVFDVGNAVGSAGIGYAWGTSVGQAGDNPAAPRLTPARFLILMMRNPPFDVLMIMVTLRLLDLRLPHAVISLTSTVGAANTFLAMFMVGIALELRLPARKYGTAALYLSIRLAFAAAFSLAVWFLLPLPTDVRAVLAVLIFAPLASIAPAFTAEAKSDVQLSSFMNSASILIAIVAMPAVLALTT